MTFDLYKLQTPHSADGAIASSKIYRTEILMSGLRMHSSVISHYLQNYT